jgi:hypothetical protein
MTVKAVIRSVSKTARNTPIRQLDRGRRLVDASSDQAHAQSNRD